jgi:hypothetical protein
LEAKAIKQGSEVVDRSIVKSSEGNEVEVILWDAPIAYWTTDEGSISAVWALGDAIVILISALDEDSTKALIETLKLEEIPQGD